MRKIVFFLLVPFVFACGPRDFEPPESVIAILDKAGDNREELEKVIKHYKESGEVLKEEAAYFLIGNMEDHGYLDYVLLDSIGKKVDFDVLSFKDYEALLDGWDQIEEKRGEIHFKVDTLITDFENINADYLIQNIDLAFEAWEGYPWAKHLSFDQFCEYVLPYRSSNEPMEEWRSFFMDELSWVVDSIIDKSDPVEAACFVNDYIKSWFRFDPRYYEHPTDQGLAEILQNKMGRCEDMTNLAIYAMRSLAIPVMSDFTPYWAKTGNNHAWNAILNKNDSVIIFMGGEANPGHYELHHQLAKVYRKTFSEYKWSLGVKMEEWEIAPPYLGKKSIKDVTDQYVPTKSVYIDISRGSPDSTNFVYLCVFNSGEWKAIDYTRFKGAEAKFSKVGMNVAFLPAFYHNHKIIPAGDALILSDSGKVVIKKPDFNNSITIEINATTYRVTKQSTDFIAENKLITGKKYTLFYWDDEWIKAGNKEVMGEVLLFDNIPSNTFYWLIAEDSREEERIFTINEEGKQVWW